MVNLCMLGVPRPYINMFKKVAGGPTCLWPEEKQVFCLALSKVSPSSGCFRPWQRLNICVHAIVVDKVFGGLRKGEKFTVDKKVIVRTEARSDTVMFVDWRYRYYIDDRVG